MKKGTKIQKVLVEGTRVTALGVMKNGESVEIPLTRAQRNLFVKYKNTPEFMKQLYHEFGNENVLTDDFKICKVDC